MKWEFEPVALKITAIFYAQGRQPQYNCVLLRPKYHTLLLRIILTDFVNFFKPIFRKFLMIFRFGASLRVGGSSQIGAGFWISGSFRI